MNEINSFFKSAARGIFLIPVGLVIFFYLAPSWQNYKIRNTISENISKVPSLNAEQSEKFLNQIANADFATICSGSDSAESSFRDSLKGAGYCSTFEYFQWSLWLSVGALFFILITLLATQILAKASEKSASSLLVNFKWAWRLNIAHVILQLLVQTPLLAYAIYEFTVLLANRYFPQLIGMVLFAAGFAIYSCFRILFARIPLQFNEENAKILSRESSPELWAAIDQAAAKMQTHKIDNIILGMSENFYVTELQVQTAGGKVDGRTLYLSYPLLQSLTADEVMAIVHHELAHFKGDDTKMTREFYPFLLKVNRTVAGLASAGVAALVANSLLQVFFLKFKLIQQAQSRHRELAADGLAAESVSARAMAQALVKVSALAQAYLIYLTHVSLIVFSSENPAQDAVVPISSMSEDLNLNLFFQKNIFEHQEFWSELADIKSLHPLDSHPPLRDRLLNLGFTLNNEELMTFASFDNRTSGFEKWFSSNPSLINEMQKEWNQKLMELGGQNKILLADESTAEGKAVLQSEFPELIWTAKPQRFWKLAIAFLFVVALLLGFGIFANMAWFLKVLLGGGALLLLYALLLYYRNHWRGVIQLDHAGVTYSGFSEKLFFTDVVNISAQQINGKLSILFNLKAKRKSYLKFTVFPREFAVVPLEISDFNEKPEKIFLKMEEYFLRLKSVDKANV